MRIINQITESWNIIAPEIAARKASLDIIKKYKELTNSFDGQIAQCLFAFIRENVPKDRSYGKEYVNSQAGNQILQQFGWDKMYKQDLTNLSNNDFLSNFNQIIIYTSYIIQHQFSNLSQGQDSNYQLIDILPAFEDNFESIYNDLAEQIVNEEDPYIAHDISFGHKGRIHTKSEILYQCKYNDDTTGNQYIRNITIDYKGPVTIYDIFNVYRDFYGSLQEFIEEGKKICQLIQIFNAYYEKPTKVFKKYIDKNFEYCLNIIQKVIPKYITENESHNFFIEIEKVCHTKKHKEKVNKMANFFKSAHLKSDEGRAKLKANKEHNQDLSKLEPTMKDVRRYIEELRTISKGENGYNYRQARERLCSQIEVLKKFHIEEAKEGIKAIEKVLEETKNEEKRFKMIDFYRSQEPSIKALMNFLKEAIDKKDVNEINAYKNGLKNQLANLDIEINKFEGDQNELKKFQPLKNLVDEANDLLSVKIGGKSAECLQAESIYLMQVEPFLTSIEMMANLPANPGMAASLNMMKTQLNNIVQNLEPFKDESHEIKTALDRLNEGMRKLDVQIEKCSG